MKSRHLSLVLRLGCVTTLVAAMGVAQAQTVRRIGAATQPTAPTSASTATFGLPNPAGLTSTFPAGLPTPPTPGVPSTGSTTTGSAAVDAGVAVQPNVPGGVAAGGVATPRLAAGASGSGPYSAVDIARSFIEADANRDGELTRAEAQRLTIAPYSFEEMDRNHDGVISRFEYEDATR